MKKIYTFFALLLLCAVTAVAQTTVTIVDGINPPYETYGTRSNGNTTFTSNAASGMAGVTIVAPVIDRASWWSTYCLALKPANVQTTENVTITAPNGYLIWDYDITLQAISSSTPYEVTIGGTTANITGAAQQTFTPPVFSNSTSFSIKQTSTNNNWLAAKSLKITLFPDNQTIVSDFGNLSNSKAYSIICKRGHLSTYNGKIASTNYSQVTTGKNFAIINYENAYYLYSVEDAMFVQQDGTLDTYPNGSTVSFSATTSPLYQIKFGTNFLNVNDENYGWVINTWSTPDDGNQFVIIEAGDFDPTDALEKFADRTPYYEALNAAITAAGNVPFGTTLHTYVKSDEFDNALATAQSTYANGDATIEELTAATQALTTAIDACELNMPTEGMFLRLRSVNGANAYLKAVAAGTRMTVTTTADVNTIFCYTADHKLVPYVHGIPINNVREIGNAGGDASIFTFVKGLNGSVGTYSIGATYSGNTNYLYSTGVDGSDADRNTYSTQHIDKNTWTLEEVTELPITLHSVDGTNYFATFSAPVAVRIEGATLNNVTPKANSISYKAVDTNLLPANTGVLLTGESESATAYVVTDEVADASYGLQAYDAALAVEEDDKTKLFLGKNSNDKVGFYRLGSAKTNGFKAYFANPSGESGEAKEGFDLVNANETTGVETIDNSQLTIDNAPVYNLQGQRVNKAQKGVFIQNGKKVVVK